MQEINQVQETLKRIRTIDLWIAIARRCNVKFGKVEMAFHDGFPSEYVHIDQRLSIKDAELQR